ncbi:MAG TPA: hypothetical protein ENI07_01025 [Desulfobacterales bacterium]|nr:hypothetical protein [Desulfobacterales bacterium]
MSKRIDHIILTVDYEIFGNGTGSLRKCLISPTYKILNIAEQYDAPVTFFVEVLEFDAMKREGMKSQPGMLTQITAVEQQIHSAIWRGHDVQLHLHPQWIGAKHVKNGAWELDMARWRIGDLSSSEAYKILDFGKNFLENMINPINPKYKCQVFRAGAWCIQPSSNILKVLKELEFKIDSTVVPGLKNILDGEWFDFYNAPNLPYWLIDEDVCKNGKQGLYEIPILSGKVSRFKHGKNLADTFFRKESDIAPNCQGNYGKTDNKLKRIIARLFKLLNIGRVMLDISTMPSEILIEITRNWITRFGNENIHLPIVAIGHTKNFTHNSEKELKNYLSWSEKQGIAFSTFGQWLDGIGKRK